MQTSTFTCEGCGATKTGEGDPVNFGISTLILNSQAVDGQKVVHLDDPCLEQFMDGSLSGNDLFLTD